MVPTLLMINPWRTFPEDMPGRPAAIRGREKLMNIGVLAVVTYAHQKGFEVQVLDLTNEDDPSYRLLAALDDLRPDIVGIGCMSCYGYQALIECAKITREALPQAVILTGGQHTGPLGKVVLDDCPAIDGVVQGEGEPFIDDLLTAWSTRRSPACLNGLPGVVTRSNLWSPPHGGIPLDNLPPLNFSLYPRWQTFVPYIEESRGCPWACAFCTSPAFSGRVLRRKSPHLIAAHIGSAHQAYNGATLTFYMESEIFGFDHRQTQQLAEVLGPFGDNLSWRAEARADTFPTALTMPLVDAGLRVLDIGLESASPKMLLAMAKTPNPKAYLESCVAIAEAISRDGRALFKVNILLYPGETTETLRETESFVRLLSEICPLGLTACPVISDPGTVLYKQTLSKIEDGNGPVLSPFWRIARSYPVELSPEMDHTRANDECLRLMQTYQSARSYYEVRRHSELPYGLTFEDFLDLYDDLPESKKPFHA